MWVWVACDRAADRDVDTSVNRRDVDSAPRHRAEAPGRAGDRYCQPRAGRPRWPGNEPPHVSMWRDSRRRLLTLSHCAQPRAGGWPTAEYSRWIGGQGSGASGPLFADDLFTLRHIPDFVNSATRSPDPSPYLNDRRAAPPWWGSVAALPLLLCRRARGALPRLSR